MALLTPAQVTIAGTVTTKAAAQASETFKPGDDIGLSVLNGSGSSVTVTVVVPGNSKYGLANPDVVVTIAAGAEKTIGPFPADLADPADGLVHVTISPTATVTRSLVRI